MRYSICAVNYILLVVFGIGLMLIGVCEGKMYNWIEVQKLLNKLFFRAHGSSKSNLPAAFFEPFRFENHIHLWLHKLYIQVKPCAQKIEQ